ncbi:ribonuclease H-like domain-containing protein [Tanacetum coccineum]
MVSTEEMRIRNKSPSLSVSTNSSAPQVLLTETPHRVQDTRTNKERDNRNNNKTEVDEYNALIKNNTWVLVPRPPDANIVRSLWLFRHKHNADGSLNRYKARLVANGSTQIAGIDVDETFSPVVKPATIRTVLSLAISRHWPVHQLDVKNAFLHGSLSETVYMHQPPGFRDPRHPDHVCLLQRSLYGLKQAPRAWFQRFAAYAARRIIASLHAEFSMTDLDRYYFLGVSVTRNTSGMFLSPQKYATDSKLAATGDPVSDPTLYRRLARALQYLTFTRPDISYAVQQVCLFMHDPREPHFSALKRICSGVYADWVDVPLHVASTSSAIVVSWLQYVTWS